MKKQVGYTLIEIMIALLLGLIIVAATITIYITTIRGSTDTIRSARLNHDLESVMTLMVNDIKRAGYWGGAVINADSRDNPFTAASTNLNIIGGNCILYSYDGGSGNTGGVPHNGNGAVDSDEFYGFKFTNNSIQMRITGTNTTDCDDGIWQEFIDGNQLNITALQFSITALTAQAAAGGVPALPALNGTSRCINVTTNVSDNGIACGDAAAEDDNVAVKRVVNIRLAGTLDADASVTKTLSSTVKVRNDHIFEK
ncbi:MAG: prepilin-type N-terminal cleavage/methylation domain-containing protein [Methylobacter sp.]|uniref:PilW family protein n=1 Tax=Methylobacter sp. TaxID=2051955 RepID=UPI00258B9756|nr:prepilin-type N-terminal cleavage/methylation domain-containing protein [Methylobacter sp.]MCL7420084.1 prepilin-type N-terminal cleavage/methylation domain-containing protein [Methylobacter sp.]